MALCDHTPTLFEAQDSNVEVQSDIEMARHQLNIDLGGLLWRL